MEKRSPNGFTAQAKVMKALAHPTRLFVVDQLSRSERCVCELTEMIGVEMPTVSRHLSVLKEARLVDDEKRGAKIFYRLRVPRVLNFFQVHGLCSNSRRRGENCGGEVREFFCTIT